MKERTLEITKDFIRFSDDKFQVMNNWEESLMLKKSQWVCENGGDILEIGFGMGISAGYMHSHSISSHTIIENHPEVIPKAQAWASGKSNVTIITGSWYDVRNSLSTYDGVFYDTFGDDDMIHFSASLSSLVKKGGVATWWNNLEEENNFYNIPNVTYQQYSVDPPTNMYFNNKTYYLPKWQQ